MPDHPGQPPYVPNDKDRAIVEAMGRVCTHDQIARVIGISDVTMRKYYRRELDIAKDKVDAAVGQTLIFQALGGPEQNWEKAIPASTIFYAKTRMGWKEPPTELKHTGGGENGEIEYKDVSAREFIAGEIARIVARLRPPRDPEETDG